MSPSPREILLIDDEPSVLFALRLLLEALGFKVHAHGVPSEAIEALKSGLLPDLIICDLRMPKLNGIGVLTETKSFRPEIPFILMSAHASTEEVNSAKELGAFGFLAKPFSPEDLNALVGGVKLP